MGGTGSFKRAKQHGISAAKKKREGVHARNGGHLNRINALDGFSKRLSAVAAAVEAAAAEGRKDAGDEQHEHERSPGGEGGSQLAADDGAEVG